MPTEPDDASQNASAEPKYVTADELGNMVNAAVTSHTKRLEKQFTAALETALKPVHEKLSAPPPPPPSGGEEKKVTAAPEYLALQKQLEEMKANLTREAEARANAERKAREDKAFGELKSMLGPQVRPELLDVLASHLFAVDKRVDFEDDGTPVFKWKGTYEEERLPLKDGISQFLKSDAAKPFLPAPASGGAPPLPKRSPTPGGPQSSAKPDYSKPLQTDDEKAQRAQQRAAEMAAKLAAARKT